MQAASEDCFLNDGAVGAAAVGTVEVGEKAENHGSCRRKNAGETAEAGIAPTFDSVGKIRKDYLLGQYLQFPETRKGLFPLDLGASRFVEEASWVIAQSCCADVTIVSMAGR